MLWLRDIPPSCQVRISEIPGTDRGGELTEMFWMLFVSIQHNRNFLFRQKEEWIRLTAKLGQSAWKKQSPRVNAMRKHVVASYTQDISAMLSSIGGGQEREKMFFSKMFPVTRNVPWKEPSWWTVWWFFRQFYCSFKSLSNRKSLVFLCSWLLTGLFIQIATVCQSFEMAQWQLRLRSKIAIITPTRKNERF